jgi:hypothetical protein
MATIEPIKKSEHGDNVMADLKRKKLIREVLGSDSRKGIFNLFSRSSAGADDSASKVTLTSDAPKNKNS